MLKIFASLASPTIRSHSFQLSWCFGQYEIQKPDVSSSLVVILKTIVSN